MSKQISILISNYNNGQFLERCIKSCLRQTFINKEIIIIDDLSNDNSRAILKKYQKFRNIKIIFNKKKISNYPALNQLNVIIKAFKFSKGKIICLLDSDDFFKKNKLKEIYKYFKKNTNQDFIQDMPYFYFSKNKKILKYLNRSNSKSFPSFYPTSTMSFSRNFFKKFIFNCFFKKFPLIEIDARIAVYVNYLYSHVPYIKKNLTNYYQNNFGINSNNIKFSLNWWIKRNEMYSFLKTFYIKKKIKFNISLDYLITRIIFFLLMAVNVKYKNKIKSI